MKNMKFENIISSKGYGWLTERITKQTAPGCGPYSIDDDAFDYLTNEDVRDTELDEFCEYLYTEHEEPENLDDLDLYKREELLLKYYSIEYEDDWYAVLMKSTKSEIEEVIEHLNTTRTAETYELQMTLRGMLEYLED